MTRAELEACWLHLTRDALPAQAPARGWPIAHDHCFQRVLLDNACGGPWYDRIIGRPAYRCADRPTLQRAVRLAEAALNGTADLPALNARSLAWRGEKPVHPPRPEKRQFELF